ncbi:putative sugar O-methyltransferase [Nocardioides terrisoli]|uniref:putative sugar O-methyltransferase n=1 Tax=Nocardioides terrisoli TaxID=3388267 RepID=UPI00287BA65D|nr:putative sugar O-methyltransferase [Nocardioides marmorisolisilvae]
MSHRMTRARNLAHQQAMRARRFLNEHGWDVQRLDEESRRHTLTSYDDTVPLPPGAAEYLRPDNPLLRELRSAYAGLEAAAAAPTLWEDSFVDDQVSLPWFRGDNAYVWQYRALRGGTEARMYINLLQTRRADHLGLLDRLTEDGLFGVWTFDLGGQRVSRDLLDSIDEINYLDSRLGLSERGHFSVLDIGAGYGRLAHRMAEAFPGTVTYDCMDGVPHSTFLSDYYLRFRDLHDARAVRLDRLEDMHDSYDIAVNVHSFTECPLEAVEWWLELVAKKSVEWLLVVPNHPTELLTTEADGVRRDFRPSIEAAGYQLVDFRPVHEEPELRRLIGTDHHFFLFQRG